MPRPIFQAGCPDIGVTEVPNTIARMHEMVRFAIERANRHRQWENLMDPRRKEQNKVEFHRQISRIHIWKTYYEMELFANHNGKNE